MSEKVTTNNSVTFDNGNTVVLDNEGKKLDVKSLSDDDLISYRNKVRNDGGDTSEYQKEINRRYNSDPNKYASWGAKKPAKKEEPKKEPKKQNKTTSPSAAPEGHSQMEEDEKLQNEKAKKLANTLTTGTSIGADGKIKTSIPLNDPIANNAKKQLEKSIKDGSFEEKSKKDYAAAKEEYSINKDPLTLSKEQFDKSKFSLTDVIKKADEKGWSAKETRSYLDSISPKWEKSGEASGLYYNLFGLEDANNAHDKKNKEWQEQQAYNKKKRKEWQDKWDAEKEAEAKKIEEATKDMTEEERRAYLKKINADKSIYEFFGAAPSEAAMMEDVREGMMEAGERGSRPKGALEGVLIEEEQQRLRDQREQEAINEKNRNKGKGNSTPSGGNGGSGSGSGSSGSNNGGSGNGSSGYIPEGKDEGASEKRNARDDMTNIIKAKKEIAALDAAIAREKDPQKKRALQIERDDAIGRLKTISDYYSLDMDKIMSYGDEGKEVEDAVKSNYENEGWLINSWVKKAGRVGDQIKDVNSQIKAAKEAGKDTSALEAKLKDLKEEKSNIHSKYGYFLFDAIRTGLQNMAIPGAYGHGPGNKQSLWDKEVNTNLEADLNRHNKAKDATIQEMIDGLAKRHGADADQVKAANDLLNNEAAVRQASRLGILQSADKLEAAIAIKNRLGIEDWNDAIMAMTLMGYDPTASAVTTGFSKLYDALFDGPKQEKL